MRRATMLLLSSAMLTGCDSFMAPNVQVRKECHTAPTDTIRVTLASNQRDTATLVRYDWKCGWSVQ